MFKIEEHKYPHRTRKGIFSPREDDPPSEFIPRGCILDFDQGIKFNQ
jgi:hypothetical protein